jgi:hypothetical protein
VACGGTEKVLRRNKPQAGCASFGHSGSEQCSSAWVFAENTNEFTSWILRTRCNRDPPFMQWLESRVAEFYLMATCLIRKENLVFSTARSLIFHHHHHHHISVMQLGHLLTRSGLTCPEVSSKVCHDSFCQSDSSVSLPWIVYYEAFFYMLYPVSLVIIIIMFTKG